MLGTLDNAQKANWKKHIKTLVHASNSTRHDTTGFTSFYLMFGRESVLPVDVGSLKLSVAILRIMYNYVHIRAEAKTARCLQAGADSNKIFSAEAEMSL